MFKDIRVHATFNERTGYGIHASRFFPVLKKLAEQEPDRHGYVNITLLDVVSAGQAQSFPEAPSILFNVWESTKYPDAFMANMQHYDMLWVPSEWQRACSIAQGIPEECVQVVPEGVDVDIYKPLEPFVEGQKSSMDFETFRFVTVGQWQPRKSTQEIIESFIKAFPVDQYPDVRLELSVDTLFPSDTYKSTEERLEAYGLQDPRIIVVHFEEREHYVRRLQTAHCFVSCARSEGWGLPIIEAMACGVPTIVADWSGSTEYATDAIKVRVKELIKPFGIYCDWEVPGEWCQPDYDHLVEQMQHVYNDWVKYKEDAMASSERIRRDFSWEAAARKAVTHLNTFQERFDKIDNTLVSVPAKGETAEDQVRAFAATLGIEITGMQKRSAIFAVDCWPSSDEKMDTLRETIEQIKLLGYPVLVSSHFPLPVDVIQMADYYLYEQRDIMSGDDKPTYWRVRVNGQRESKVANVEYQGVAAINCFRNSIDFCRGRFDWIYQMGADMEVDLKEWLRLVMQSQKSMVCIPYEGNKDGIGGGLWAGRTEVLDRYIPRLNSWKEYADKFPDLRFVAEKWLYAHLVSEGCNIEKELDWIDIYSVNRFDNVDRDIWEDDDFVVHFVDGPFLEIPGISRRQYDVSFIDKRNQENVYGIRLQTGNWARASHKYFRPWIVTAHLDGKEMLRHELDLTGKNVIVSFGSKALGDTIAWMPYLEEFRKKNNIATMYCSGWWQEIFDYPNIKFVKPGTALPGIYASYSVGCFDNQPDMNPINWREVPLQKVAADILGLEFEPIRAKLKVPPYKNRGKKYVCFSEFSTMRGKLWNRPGAWQEIINYLNGLGYECISVAAERTGLQNVKIHAGQPIQKTIADIAGCDFYIGLNHGPAWIAYALNKPTIMITGMSEPWNDFPNDYRIAVDSCRPGCFNDPSLPINRDWEWCPRNKDYVCTRDITEGMVINAIDKIVEGLKCQSPSAETKEAATKSGPPTVSTPKTLPLKKQKHRNACLTQ